MTAASKEQALRAFAQGDYENCRAHLESASAEASTSGSTVAEADALRLQGNLASHESRPDAALPLLDAALARYQESDVDDAAQVGFVIALTQLSRGCVLTALGRLDEAHAAFQSAVADLTVSGDDALLAVLYDSMLVLAEHRGQTRVVTALKAKVTQHGGVQPRPLGVAARPSRVA